MGAKSTATVNDGYAFVGWYEDAACTKLVEDDETLILVRPDDGEWKEVTYYAKFTELKSMIIRHKGTCDEDQVFVYKVQSQTDPDFVIYVTAVGNSDAVITRLPADSYTVTQDNDWSWRQNDTVTTQDKVHGSSEDTLVEFTNNIKEPKWLNDNSAVRTNTHSD